MRSRSRSPNSSAISDNTVPYKCKIIFRDQISNQFIVNSFVELLQKIPAQFNDVYGHKFNILVQEGDKIKIIQTGRDFKQSVHPQNYDSELATTFYCHLDQNGQHFLINPETQTKILQPVSFIPPIQENFIQPFLPPNQVTVLIQEESKTPMPWIPGNQYQPQAQQKLPLQFDPETFGGVQEPAIISGEEKQPDNNTGQPQINIPDPTLKIITGQFANPSPLLGLNQQNPQLVNNHQHESLINQQAIIRQQKQWPPSERESPANTYPSQPQIKQPIIDSNKILSSSSSQRKPSHAEEEDRRNQSGVSGSSLKMNELVEKENQIRKLQDEISELQKRLEQRDMQISQLKLEVSQKDQEILKLSSSKNQQQQRSTCYKCKGEPRRRLSCQTCEGSGYLSDSFNQELQHRIKEFIDLSLPQAIVTINKGMNQVSGMIEPHKPVNFNQEAQQRRYLEQAEKFLQSQPLGLPRVEQNRQALDLAMVSESFTENFNVAAGTTVTKKWYLKNTGTQYIPKNSCLQKVNEEKIKVFDVPIGKDIPVGSYFQSEIQFKAPSEPGHYRICLQMKKYQQQASQMIMEKPFFGEKVWCDFIVQDPRRDEGLQIWQDMNNIVDKSKERKNGISSLIHIPQLPPYVKQPEPVQPPLQMIYQQEPMPGPNNHPFPVQVKRNKWDLEQPVNIPPFVNQPSQPNFGQQNQEQIPPAKPIYHQFIHPSSQPEVVKQPQIDSQPKQPKVVKQPSRGSLYDEALDRLRPEDEQFRDLLQTLREFQQLDFERNLKLAKRFANDPDPVNRVIDELLVEENGDEDPQSAQPVSKPGNGVARPNHQQVQGGIDEATLNATIEQLLSFGYGSYEECKEACLIYNCDIELIMNNVRQ